MSRSGSSTIAFLKKDMQIAVSYRVPFLFDFVGAFFVIFEFFYLSKIVPSSGVTGDYLGFVVAGLVVTTFLITSASAMASNIRQEQVQGTLEVTLSAGLSLRSLSLGLSAYPLVSGAIRAVIYTLIAAVLGARLPGANWGLAFVAMALGSLSFVAIGLMAVGVVVVFRQAAGAIGWLLGAATLLAGVMFPVQLLPGWLRFLSGLSAATWTLRTVRAALLSGDTVADQWRALALLLLMGSVYAVLAMWVLAAGFGRARKTGGLSQY